jgi:hypothetical protein
MADPQNQTDATSPAPRAFLSAKITLPLSEEFRRDVEFKAMCAQLVDQGMPAASEDITWSVVTDLADDTHTLIGTWSPVKDNA